MFQVLLVLALAAGYNTASSPHFLDVNIDNVRKMVLEYDPVVRDHETGHAKRQESEVPHHSLAIRQFQEDIKKAELNAQAGLIPEVAASLGLTTLVDVVVKAGLKDTLESAGPFTVFGPTNEAFANLPEWAKQAITNVTVLADILKFHVVPGKVFSSSLTNDLQAATANGEKVRINLYTVNEKLVATAQCAPIDLNRVDQNASNGVIHLLNAVMIPPVGNIVTTAVACPAFKTLVKAVQVAGLADTLSGPGPFTLFAPTENAFAKLPPGTLAKLLKDPKQLGEILKYHVVSGTFCSSGLTSGNVKTVQGQDVSIKVSGGVTVNNANVISADGSVTNGVIHAIDTVLLPPGY